MSEELEMPRLYLLSFPRLDGEKKPPIEFVDDITILITIEIIIIINTSVMFCYS